MAHLVVAIFTWIADLCENFGWEELSKVLDIVAIPIYLFTIMQSQLLELKLLSGDEDTYNKYCENKGQVRMHLIWMTFETRIFYGYILSAMLFCLVANFKRISSFYQKNSHDIHEVDFMDVNKIALGEFSLYCFEAVVGVEIMFESVYRSDNFSKGLVVGKGSYMPSMILLLISGIFSVGQAVMIFVDVEPRRRKLITGVMTTFKIINVMFAGFSAYETE